MQERMANGVLHLSVVNPMILYYDSEEEKTNKEFAENTKLVGVINTEGDRD